MEEPGGQGRQQMVQVWFFSFAHGHLFDPFMTPG